MSTDTYIETVGRRKTAVARVRLTPAGRSGITVNDKALDEFFPTKVLQNTAREALDEAKDQKFKVTVKVVGGGSSAQADAMRHGIARALVKHNAELRSPLKKKGFLTRDQRAKERRKFGLKKARKAAQWSKR